MANPWFRFYHEFAFDPKVQRLSEVNQRRFVMILCLRCCNGEVTLPDDDVTFTLRITDEEWQETKNEFIKRNLIDRDNMPIAWDKRQMPSDLSTSRVKKHRAKQATSDETVSETVNETDHETGETFCNGLEEKREEEIRTEEDKIRIEKEEGRTDKIGKGPDSPSKKKELSDSEWLESLKLKAAYKGLEIDIIYSKMQNWCEQNKKIPSRKRFINWLNREERPMQHDGKAQLIKPATARNMKAFHALVDQGMV